MSAASHRERSPRHAVRDAGAAALWALGATRPWLNRRGAEPLTLRRVDVDGALNAQRDGSASPAVLAWRLARGRA